MNFRIKSWAPNSAEISIVQKNSTIVKCSGIRGLRNLGSTCFMNSVLQCFIHNPLLRNYFLGYKHIPEKCNVSTNCMICELFKLFQSVINTIDATGL